MDVPVCLEDCFDFLFLRAEAACFAPLQFHLGSWCPILFHAAERQGMGGTAQSQVGVLRKVARQLSPYEGKTLLPHRVAMSKKKISRAGCSCLSPSSQNHGAYGS